MKLILSKDQSIIQSIVEVNRKPFKFLKPKFKCYEHEEIKYPRDIIVYRTNIMIRLSPMVKSGIKILKVRKNNKLIGYTLKYSIEKIIDYTLTIPRGTNLMFDKANKQIKLSGKNVLGGWVPQITPLYNEKNKTLLTVGGIIMVDHIKRRNIEKKLEEEKKKKWEKNIQK